MDALDRGVGTNTESTGGRDSTYSRMGSSAQVVSDFGTNMTEGWVHFYVNNISGNASNGTPMILRNSAGSQFIRINAGEPNWTLQYWSGSAWTSVGSSTGRVDGGYIDIHFKIGTGDGILEWYVNSVLVASSTTLNLNAYSEVRSGQWNHAQVGYAYSQVLASDTATIGVRCLTVPPTSNGTDTGGTGAVTDINESTINTSTFVSFDTAGQRRSTVSTARSLTRQIKAVTVSGQIRKVDSTGPQSIKPYLLISGTRYYGTTFALTVGIANYQYTWNTNPATSAPWTTADANSASLEMGWEAVA